MAATFNWAEDNGAITGGHGTTRNQLGSAPSNTNWKNIDDATSAYSSYPIVAGNNSYVKYQYGQFSGSFNQISACTWSPHTAGVIGTGVALKGLVTSTYVQPSTTSVSGYTDYTSIVAVGSGATVLFSTTDPSAASPTSTLSAAGFTQYLSTQLQTTTSAAAGDIAPLTGTLSYSEN